MNFDKMLSDIEEMRKSKVMNEQIGLVLEGGGMKGLYTAGVLEYFLENGLYFPYVIGVSAGACMAASYLSKQHGRNKEVNVGLVGDHRFVSLRNFILRREVFGMDFLFDEVPNKLVPFDFTTFLQGNEQFIVGTTNCATGAPVYFNKHEHGSDILKIIRASSSLPLLAPAVTLHGLQLLDGGISDPIPIKKAKKDGNQKNVIILTSDGEQLQKKPNPFPPFLKYLLRKYPKIVEQLENGPATYQETLAYIEAEQQHGAAFVMRPSKRLPISRIERSQTKLLQLYELGYADAKRRFSDLLQFLYRGES